MAKPQYSGPWQRLRKQILERDSYLCQIRSTRCTGTATHVDHIIPVTDQGAWWDPTNLRAACKNCNLGRNNQPHNQKWKTAPTHIHLVTGPPGINKQQDLPIRPDHLVIDYDQLADTLNPQRDDRLHKAVLAARGGILKQLKAGAIPVPHAWIISSNRKAADYLPHHTIHLVDPGLDIVTQQIRQNFGNTPHARQLLRLATQWYREGHTPTPPPSPSNTTSRRW